MKQMRNWLNIWLVTEILISISKAATTLPLDSQQRLKAKISLDSMNRLAVMNDRITQVFGDMDAYELQIDEKTGQVFIKVTAENGSKPLSLTIITENNLIQDLSLEPCSKEAATIILKSGEGANPIREVNYEKPAFNNTLSLSFQEQLIQCMKSLVTGTAPLLSTEVVLERKNKTIQLVAAYQLGAFKGLKFFLQNLTQTAIELQEKDFYEVGDLALSFKKRIIQAGETTFLYVVTR